MFAFKSDDGKMVERWEVEECSEERGGRRFQLMARYMVDRNNKQETNNENYSNNNKDGALDGKDGLENGRKK